MECSCKESKFEGIPCRHELCVYVKGSKALSNLNFHKRWTKQYFNIEQLPDKEDEGIEGELEEEMLTNLLENEELNQENENSSPDSMIENERKTNEIGEKKVKIVSFVLKCSKT